MFRNATLFSLLCMWSAPNVSQTADAQAEPEQTVAGSAQAEPFVEGKREKVSPDYWAYTSHGAGLVFFRRQSPGCLVGWSTKNGLAFDSAEIWREMTIFFAGGGNPYKGYLVKRDSLARTPEYMFVSKERNKVDSARGYPIGHWDADSGAWIFDFDAERSNYFGLIPLFDPEQKTSGEAARLVDRPAFKPITNLHLSEPIVDINGPFPSLIRKAKVGELVQVQIRYAIAPPFPKDFDVNLSNSSVAIVGVHRTQNEVAILSATEEKKAKIGVGFVSVLARAARPGRCNVEVRLKLTDDSVKLVPFSVEVTKADSGG